MAAACIVARSEVAAAAVPVTAGFSDAAAVRVPQLLGCDHLPVWRSFRERVVAVVEGGFVKDPALEKEAEALVERWRPFVCLTAECRTSAELGFEFLKDLHQECVDSPNFERYLVRHYFKNTGLTYDGPASETRGFCLYGYVAALVVVAWHAVPEHVGYALQHLYMAQHLLGHYHSFDYLESSSWPVSSFLILINLRQVGQTLVPMLEPPEYAHPGEFGASWYYERLAWAGTTEAAKPKPGIAPFRPLPFDAASTAGWRGRGSLPARPRVIVWQFCIHTSTAGEALTMIRRFLHKEFDVQFRGNSVAVTLCKNYEPHLCAQGEKLEFLDRLVDRLMADEAYEQLSQDFTSRMLPELVQADVWMCSIPAVWCRLLFDAARSPGAPQPTKPIFAYLGLPLLQYTPSASRLDFLEAFRQMAVDERNIVVANNPYLAEEVLWQTGVRIPTVRIHGLHTGATYLPSRLQEVLVSRPGTSGGLEECMLNRFVEANPGYPIRFVQFTHLLDPQSSSSTEVYNESLSYAGLGSYRALVCFPYDTSLMLFWEFYSMGMPIFVPRQLWRWGVFGQHTRRDLEWPVLEKDSGFDRPPFSPFFDGFMPLEVERAVFWSKYTDWAMFPHVQYFATIAELMVKVATLDVAVLSAQMKAFNEEAIAHSVAVWQFVVERWLDLETLT